MKTISNGSIEAIIPSILVDNSLSESESTGYLYNPSSLKPSSLAILTI